LLGPHENPTKAVNEHIVVLGQAKPYRVRIDDLDSLDFVAILKSLCILQVVKVVGDDIGVEVRSIVEFDALS
jgi:hypothetical protein